MFATLTTVRAKPGQREALIAVNEKMQAVTVQETGVPVYIFHTVENDPDEFVYYDFYATEEAFDAHCQTEAFQQMLASIGELANFIDMKRLVPFGHIKSQSIHS